MKLPIPTDSWQVLQALHPNVLIVHHDPQQRTRTVEAVLQGCRAPVWRSAGQPLSLPLNGVGTLVIDDVSVLTPDEQRALLLWVERNRTTQIVTVSPVALYPAVEAGTFLDGLYYRMNVLLVSEHDV